MFIRSFLTVLTITICTSAYTQIDSMAVDTAVKPQPVYKVNKLMSGIISLVGTGTNIWAIPNIIHNKKNLTDQELDALRHDIVNGFDRWALEQDPVKRDVYYKASDYVLPGVVAVSVFSLLRDKKIKKDWWDIALMYYEMHAITFNLYNFSFFGPNFQNRVRPFSYYDHFPREERKTGNQRNSLYSGHTASTAASTFFAVKVYSDYNPQIGNKKYLLYGLAAVPPLVEGYLRVKALAHFPSDNLVGLIIGGAMGIVIPELHRIEYRKVKLGINTTSTGPQLALRWNPNATNHKLLPTFRN